MRCIEASPDRSRASPSPTEMQLPSLCHRSAFWSAAFALWAVLLWFLSDFPGSALHGPGIPGFDKVLHFGYFFGGAGLLSAALFLRTRDKPDWRALIAVVVGILAVIGMVDEWHQSWVPERSGNDPADWLADLAGALAGALVFRRFHRFLA